MPYRCTTHLRTPWLSWAELTLVDARDAWSDSYHVATPRMVLPLQGWLGCHVGGRPRQADPISPLWLDPAQPYRLRQPWAGQQSLVVGMAEMPPHPAARLDPVSLASLARTRAGWGGGTLDALAVEEAVLHALQDPGAATGPATAPQARVVQRARECLAADPGGVVSLAALAHACAGSPFHLARCFRAGTGLSVHAYRTRLRMARAVHRLRQGETDLTRLALDLGYSSQSHFGAVFRRHVGQAPGRWRDALCARI